MLEHVQLDQKTINKDLLGGVLRTPKWWLPTVLFLTLVVFTGLGAFGYMMNKGLGVTGLNRPVFWGFFLVNFVFWIGISHAGIMISAILRLTQAEWRRPITRAAEVMTVFSLMAALHTPLFHVGRPWRDFWVFPYDFARGSLAQRPVALCLGPKRRRDISDRKLPVRIRRAASRHGDNQGQGKERLGKAAIYAGLCLGWRGTPRQWKLQAVAGILLSALVLPVFVSVHSIVSWDFAVVIGVEGWHSTIFAPYFIIGAIHSGVSAVAMLMALGVWMWKLDKYIRPDHFDAIGRLLIVVATTWFFFFFLEWVFALYTLEGPEIVLRELQVFQWPYSMLFMIFLFTAYLIPVPMWLFKSVRRSALWMLITTILVNIGMWLERFIIIIPGLLRRQPMTFDWGSYHPSIVEILIVAETFAFVALGMLLFSKFFPLIPLFDIKEGMINRRTFKIGRRTIPATVRE